MNIHATINNNPELKRQLKSFEDYATQVKVKRMADKMLIENLVSQLAEAKAISAINELNTKIDTLQESLKPFCVEPKTDTVTLDAESLSEIKKLKEDLAPMNKALKYKAENVTKKNTKEAIRESIRARKLLKSGS